MLEIKASLKSDGTEQETDYEVLLNKSIIDLSEEIPQQPIAISIGTHKYKGNDYPTAYGSYGDFSCIVGASKSKKTYLKSLLTSAYFGAENFAGNIRGHQSKGKYVIDIDTEQSGFHAQRVFRRVAEMTTADMKFYIPVSVRALTPTERMGLIDHIVTKSKYKDNIGLILIDGVADLVNSINDEEEANRVTNNLLRWSSIANCHIITVIHRNFGTSKPMGWVGTMVLKKAETVVFTEKDNEDICVNPEYTRNIPFDNFLFGVDSDNHLPFVIDSGFEQHIPNPDGRIQSGQEYENIDVPF